LVGAEFCGDCPQLRRADEVLAGENPAREQWNIISNEPNFDYPALFGNIFEARAVAITDKAR
jgi:hypothetical protein